MGSPTIPYSKNPNLSPSGSSADWAIILPGAPIKERLPPIAAAKTNGIRSLDLLKPDFAAIPITTGIRTAAVPVLERKPLMAPTITIMATIRPRSVLANFVTRLPISLAMPVSNSAPPTMNMATNRITLLLINPLKASLTLKTPVTTRPIQTIMDVSPNGIFSVTNMTMAKARKINVMTAGLIQPPFLSSFAAKRQRK